MDDLKVTKIDLTEIDLDSLESVEASGGNWKRVGKYLYKIVAPKAKCSYKSNYVEGPNDYSGTRKSGCCSSCKFLMRKSGYWLCESSKCKEL
ncbi:MAG: hypothetical protein Q4D04_06255 [Clostridia bacterium]|nr:hypothetical protein [Clostridia bacterium]